MDPIAQFKQNQKQGWATFAALENTTAQVAPSLVRWAGIKSGARVLDVACGTGVVALSAARLGARVTGLDLTPELIARAKENSKITGLECEWHEGDAEALPFGDASFDTVVSQFGHMFAPRPDVTIKEMLRVLKPGGTLAFSTWPPELYTGRMFALTGKYMPPPPAGVSPPWQWGDPNVVRERLGNAVKDLTFTRETMFNYTLSPEHSRIVMEGTAGPVIKLVQMLANDPPKLAAYRKELDDLAAQYFDASRNAIRMDLMISRSTKV